MKTRRRFLQRLGVLGTASVLAPAAQACTPGGEDSNVFMHIVFFWLADDKKETREKFEAELRPFIENVKEIGSRHIGTPADTDRDVIDNSWDFNLVLGFPSKKEHDIYQEHPLHKQFIENASMLWKKVLVYDSVRS